MALPELLLPDAIPAWQADGHAVELVPQFADVVMRTGHSRRRRLYTTTPRIVSVGLMLTQAQAQALHQWYEGPLQAGLVWFSAEVAHQGPGSRWWQARFAEPYEADAVPSGLFAITARLLLVGVGQRTRPYTPDMRAAVRVELTGSAQLQVPITLAAAVQVALQPTRFLAAAVRVALLGRSYVLREDGSRVLREDGNYVVREL